MTSSSRQSTSVIAFDFGSKHIGVAAGQTCTGTATELKALPARDGIPDWDQLGNLLAEWRPQKLLVGFPLNMDDSEGELAARARKFANRLHGRFGLPVELFDERLSTRAAKEEARQRGHRGDYGRQGVDCIAARLILEGWLSEHA